jgi:ubiquinone/menaquinone biosynthesis C-methylase UbiE
MRRIDNEAIRAAGEVRFRSEYDYALFEYLRSAKVILAVERSGVKLRGRVLDAGCGSGGTALSIAEEVSFAVGLDLSPRFSDSGTRLAREKGVSNVAFTQGDGLKLPYANESFDVVLSHSVIEHLPSAQTYIAECARVLKPGGRFYLSTAPTLSLAGAHLPRLRLPVPIHLFLGRKRAFRVFVFLAARAPWALKERSSANTFVKLAESGREKEDDLLTPVTLRSMSSWITQSPFKLVAEQRTVTGFFKRVIPGFLRGHFLAIPMVGDVMVSQIECVLEKP